MYQSILARSSRSILATFSVIIAFALIGSSFVAPSSVFAFPADGVNISVATGGEAVSIDTTLVSLGGTGVDTSLRQINISETGIGQISAGIHTFTLPDGWEFDTSAHITADTGDNMEPISSDIIPDLHSFSFNLTKSSNSNGSLTFRGMKVHPTGTTAPTTGYITHSGATITGVIDGGSPDAINFGTLTTVPSTVAKVIFETQPSNAVYGSVLNSIVVKTQDHFGNDSSNGATGMVTLALASDTGALLGTASLDISNGTASFDDLKVDTIGTKELTATNGVLTATSDSFVISPKPITGTLTLTAPTKEYDGNNSAVLASVTPNDIESGDTVTTDITHASATFADQNAGTKIVTATGVILTGADADNYTLGSVTGTADITKKAITVTADSGKTKVYGYADPVLTYMPNNSALIAGNFFSGELSRAPGNNFGDYAINLGTLSAGDNYLVTLDATPVNFSITKRPITVEATASSKEYDGTMTSAGIPTITAGTSLAAGDTAGFIETYVNKNVGAEKLTPSGIVNDGNGGDNYSYDFDYKMNGIITKKPLTVDGLSVASKSYNGDTVAVITGTPSLVGIVNNEAVSLSGTAVGTFDTKDVGNNKTVTVSGLTLNATDAVKANYSLTQPTLNATISAKEITITPNVSQTKVYGQNDPVFGYTHTALFGTDDVTGALGRTGDKNVGTYTYTLGSLSAGTNYSLTLGDGPSGPSAGAVDLGAASDFVILSYAGIADTPTSIITGNIGAYPISGSAIGVTCPEVHNGTIYSRDAAGPLPCRVTDATRLTTAIDAIGAAITDANGRAATVTNAGSAGEIGGLTLAHGVYKFDGGSTDVKISTDLTLNGSATDVWIFQIPGNFDVHAKVILGGEAQAKNIFWSVTGATTLFSSSVVNGTILDAGTGIAMQDHATLNGRALATPGSVTLIANTVTIPESGSSASTFAITPKLLTVTATGVNKEYNASPTATVTLSSSDIVSGDEVNLANTTATFADKNVGNAKLITVSGISKSGDDAGNYTLNGVTEATTHANITKAPLTATITVAPKEYDGINSATILSRALNEGVISGDTVTLNENGSATFDNKNVGTNKAISTEGITLGGADEGNYSLTQPSLTNGVITPRTLTVTASGVNKVYDAGTTATVNLSDNRVTNDVLTIVKSAVFTDKNVGDDKTINVTGIEITDGADKNNYILGNTTSSATANITKAPLTATITAANKVIDDNNSATILTRTLVGVLSGVLGEDDVTPNADGVATFADAIVGTGKTVSATGITLTGIDVGNYSYNGKATGMADILSIPMIVYVDKTYTDGSAGVHTFGYDAFNTIQNGIDKVATNGTVNVATGNYPENVKIFSKEGLTITGVGDSTLIAGNGYGIEIDASNNITIKDLKISTNGPDLHGIYVDGNWVGGRGISPSNNLTIQNTTINATGGANAATGIYADYVTNGAHTGWNITGNRITADGGGIGLEDVTASTVSDNIITIADGTNILWLAVKSDLANLNVSGNTVNGSGGSQVSFLTNYHDNSAGKTITGVIFHGNTADNYGSRALRIGTGVSGVVVDHNKFLDAVKPAILNESASSVNATQNWYGTTDGTNITSKVGSNVSYRSWCVEASCTTVDNDAPTVTISTTASNPTNAISVPVTATFIEAVSGFDLSDVTVGNGTADNFVAVSGTTYTFDVTPTAGTVTVKVEANLAWDLSGNFNTTSNILSINYDNVAPTAEVSYSTTAPTNQDVIATITPSETVTGDLTHTFTGNDSFTFNFTDAAGNPGTVDATVSNIDKTAPVVTISQPTVDSRVNATNVITFTNDSDLTSTVAECSVDNSHWHACTTGSTTLGDSAEFAGLSQGTFTLYLRDADTAGNTGTTQVALVKDTTAPTITSKTPSSSAVGIDPTTNITVVFNEDVIIDSGKVTISGGVGKAVTFDSGTKTATIDPNTTLSNNTTYTVTLTGVTDTVGNVLPTTSWVFTTSASYSMALTTGWNLISLPVVPTNTDASVVLGATLNDITKIETVWSYDATTGKWSAYHPGSPNTSDFSTMTAGEGYWVNYLSNDAGIIAGTGNLFQEGDSTPPQKTLAAGWNLIGYYQLENVINTTATHALSTVVGQWTQLRTYNNTDKQFQAVTGNGYMKPGEGYWIFMKSSSYAPYLYGPGDTD